MWLKAGVNFLRKVPVWNRSKVVIADQRFSARVRPRERGERVYARGALSLSPFFSIHTINEIKHTDLVKPSSRDKTDTENLTARWRARARTLTGYSGTHTQLRIARCTLHASARRRLYCSSIFYRAIYLYRPLLNDENFIANCRGRKGFYGCLCRSRVFISIPGHSLSLSLRASPALAPAVANHVASAIEKSSAPSPLRGQWMKKSKNFNWDLFDTESGRGDISILGDCTER
jgi:hypothetical protein